MRKHQANHTQSEGGLPIPPAFDAQEHEDPEHADDLEIEEGEDDDDGEGEGEGEGEEDGLGDDSDEMKTAVPPRSR